MKSITGSNKMAKQNQTKPSEEEKTSRDTLLDKTLAAYYADMQRVDFYKNGSLNAKENASLIGANFMRQNKDGILEQMIAKGIGELDGGDGNFNMWGAVGENAKQHDHALRFYTVKETIDKAIEYAGADGADKEKIEKLAAPLTKYYDKTLGELLIKIQEKREKNENDAELEELKKHYHAVKMLYDYGVEAKMSKQLYQMKMENFLGAYYKDEREAEQKKQEKK